MNIMELKEKERMIDNYLKKQVTEIELNELKDNLNYLFGNEKAEDFYLNFLLRKKKMASD